MATKTFHKQTHLCYDCEVKFVKLQAQQ